MRQLQQFFLTVFILFPSFICLGQLSAKVDSVMVVVMNEQKLRLEAAVVEVQNPETKKSIKSAITNKNGECFFYPSVLSGSLLNTYFVGYLSQSTLITISAINDKRIVITLQPNTNALKEVSVNSRKPFIQHAQGKTIINPDASVTNTGTTILEVLEKSPGVLVDKNGGISLQGKAGVLVLIDDKQTYLSGVELNNMLSSMSSSLVEQIELITSPSAKYDASGNAGIINIKTKKNKQIGFNGVLTSSYGQGRYPKINNNLILNYRNGKFNTFLNYSVNYNKGFTDLYALRHYYSNTGSLLFTLDQPTLLINQGLNNTLKTGIDFFASSKTSFGITLTGITVARKGNGDALASWKNTAGNTDSSISTVSASNSKFKNGALNLNGKHNISKKQEISFDIDMLKYDFTNEQLFTNTLQLPGGYTEASQGTLPSTIDIFSTKVDYGLQLGKDAKLESGYKTSAISTDNNAVYRVFDGMQWKDDFGKSNHFLYKENIHALYASFQQKLSSVSFQAGIRYENTYYNAHQLGNAVQKDSAFSKSYSGFFPSGFFSYQIDSFHTLTITAGRRIDRPPFQKLNPYVIIINKYTLERGSPFLLPQYSWNIELSHQFKEILTTTLSYSIIKDYFSQIFLSEGNGILVYTNSNVGKMYNLGISVAVQTDILKWWTFSGQGIYNYKELNGYQNINYHSNASQFNFSMNNQFRLGGNYTAEISGFYTSQSRNDLQELLSPTGQVSAGISKPVLKKKGTLTFSIRDIFYTQAMEGNTDFPGADEYFIIRRDSRVFNLAFTYRFGKALKNAKRSAGSAGDEIQRAGQGG